MSAYVCHPDHHKALSVWAVGRGQHSQRVRSQFLFSERPIPEEAHKEAEMLANILYRENIRSVQTRYPGDSALPGPVSLPDYISVSPTDLRRTEYMIRPIDAIKMAGCLEYQSCETDDWPDTAAAAILRAIVDAAIRELPDYNGAIRDFQLA